MKTIVLRPDGTKEVAADILKACQENGTRYDSRIRRLVRYDNLIARKTRKGLWYFSDFNNYLQSPEAGLDDEEALAYLLQE